LPISKVRNMITSEYICDHMKEHHKNVKECHNRLKELNERITNVTETGFRQYRQIDPYRFSGVYKNVIIISQV